MYRKVISMALVFLVFTLIFTPYDQADALATGGLDGFGYTYDETVPYSWISATVDSGLTGEDQFTGPVAIGFTFPFYDLPHDQLFFSTNGLITFDAGSTVSYLSGIPSQEPPNNFIAPFLKKFIGSPADNGAILYLRGGVSPNRYFVVEWRNVKYASFPELYTFETILYENGDIVFQYQLLPNYEFRDELIGIEDPLGYQGLLYSGTDLKSQKAIRFYYPTQPSAQVRVIPPAQGELAVVGKPTVFQVTITNTGSFQEDTYDLTSSSAWPVEFYTSDGSTPLLDTDHDGVVDTGPLSSYESTTITVKYSTPPGAQAGESNYASITATSTMDGTETQTVELAMSVPASFATVFVDQADGAMSFLTASKNKINTYKASADDYSAGDPALAILPNENYFYVWSKAYVDPNNLVKADIEYTVINRKTGIASPVRKLTDNPGQTISNYDMGPSVAVNSDGTIGVAWTRALYDNTLPFPNTDNEEIYFAALDASGRTLAQPVSVTTGLYTYEHFIGNAVIAAGSEDRFILGWLDEIAIGLPAEFSSNVWYAVYDAAGTKVYPPTPLTEIYHRNLRLTLNSLTAGRAIMMWTRFPPSPLDPDTSGPEYAILNSDGSVHKPPTLLISPIHPTSPDAVQLPNGKVGIAWGASDWYNDPKITVAILDSSYNIESGPTSSGNFFGDGISVTTNASSQLIITGTTLYPPGSGARFFYALADSAGGFVTDPMLYRSDTTLLYVSTNGQGLAPFEEGDDGADTVGVFRPGNGVIFLKNTNSTGFADLALNYGLAGDKPVVGDWNGDHTDTIGVYRGNTFLLRNSNTAGSADLSFIFGQAGDQPLAGDWNGDGTDTIGIYRPSTGQFLLRNSNTAGPADITFYLGRIGDIGIAGDWNGDGVDTAGVFRPGNGNIFLKNINSTGFADLALNYGLAGDQPVVGDWDNNGMTTIGVFRNGKFYLRNSNTNGYADLTFYLGNPGDLPIAGNWDGAP